MCLNVCFLGSAEYWGECRVRTNIARCERQTEREARVRLAVRAHTNIHKKHSALSCFCSFSCICREICSLVGFCMCRRDGGDGGVRGCTESTTSTMMMMERCEQHIVSCRCHINTRGRTRNTKKTVQCIMDICMITCFFHSNVCIY